MSTEPVLIGGQWRSATNPVAIFSPTDPSTRTPIDVNYPVSGSEDVQLAMSAASEAVPALGRVTVDTLARFLETYAGCIETRTDALVARANLETALPTQPRLRDVELPRTTGQLRQAAAAVRDRSWCRATIDTQAKIRSKRGPLGGAVAVLGPNNFPFAFNSVAGGDFAAAVAVGNPVISKANPGHPGTTKLFAEAALEAITECGLPPATVQLLYHMPPEVGFGLVSHSDIAATAFTGSRSAGLRLKAAADAAGKPIYLEMSSTNPVFMLPAALQERGRDLANELYASCALGAGQFCTRPGLVVVLQDAAADDFVAEAVRLFAAGNPGVLLGPEGAKRIAAGVETLKRHGAEVLTGGRQRDAPGYSFENTLLAVSGDAFLKSPQVLQTEAFGTVSLIVLARDEEQMAGIASRLEGNLTGCLYSHTGDKDDALYARLEAVLRQKVGRLLNDKMPTGVAVSPAMNHGGPYPATGHPGFTAVGMPGAMERFSALHCYDNVRDYRLPPELRDKNPTGTMWRSVNGTWTQQDIQS